MKKIISAGLATILAASALSTAAFAEEFTMTAESVLAKPAIKVTMPKSMSFVFNPYQLTVDIKGKVAEGDAGKGGEGFFAVPSYLFNTGDEANGWLIKNETGASVKAAVLAYAINKTDAEFQVIDQSASLPTAAKRALKVGIKAGEEDVVLQNVTEKIDTKTKSIWDTTNGATVLEGDNAIADKASLVITFDKDTTVTAHADPTKKTAWTEKDIAKINFVFGFDLDEGE